MVLKLLKARLAATISGIGRSSRKARAKRTGTGFKVLMVILIVYIIACFLFVFGTVFLSTARVFNAAGLDWLYYALAGIMAFALCFIGSVFMAQHQIFEAKDNEMLLSMPVKPSAVLLSRVLAIYVINLAYTLVVMLPAIAVRWFMLGTSVIEIVFVIIEVLLIPVMSMALSCVFGWLLALLSSRMRNKNIITLVLSVAFLIGYFYVCMNMGNYITALSERGVSIADTVRRAIFPAYHMGVAAAEGSIVSLLIFVACAIVPFAIVFFIISRNFVSIVSTKVGAPKVKYVEKRLRANGAESALVAKELKRFTGSSMYMLNAGMGTLMAMIVAIVLLIRQEAILKIASAYGISGISVPAIVCMVLCICTSLNIISASSISLEAKTMWIVKSLPMDTGNVLMSKAFCHFLVSAGGVIVASVISSVAIKANAAETAAMILLPVALSALTSVADVLINLHMPKFDWINEVACVKQSGSVLLSMLVNLGVAVIPIILYFLLFSKIMEVGVFLFIAAAFFAVVTAALIIRLKTAGVRMFNEL